MCVGSVRGVRWLCWVFAVACAAPSPRADRLEERERPLCAPGTNCEKKDVALDEYFYRVNGNHYMVSFAEGDYYKAHCRAAALDDPAVPRFPRRMLFAYVSLNGCAPPANQSYAAALLALNVTVVSRLSLYNLPAGTKISHALSGLPSTLTSLELRKEYKADVLVPEESFLDDLQGLRALTLDGVYPARLPPKLDSLRLINTGIKEFPLEALSVVLLEITEKQLTLMPEVLAPRLKTLTLYAPVASLPLAPALERAAVTAWAERAPAPLRHCERLTWLSLTAIAAEKLPEGFVGACSELRTLEFQGLKTKTLPPRFLLNATQLLEFKISGSRIASLPDDLFFYTPNLKNITLFNMGLESLPRGIFSGLVKSLRRLSLGRNELRARDVVTTVGLLTSLRALDLSRNPLGDLCPASNAYFVTTRGLSMVSAMRNLEQLHLSNTSQVRVCADWVRSLQRLERLDLKHNLVSSLQCSDLHVQRAVDADIDLTDNPLVRVDCSAEDYAQAASLSIPKQMAKLLIDSRLTCDCDAYWLARVLRDHRSVNFDPVCGNTTTTTLANIPVRSVPLHSLSCNIPHCASNCTCDVVPAVGGVKATCTGAALPVDQLTRPEPRLLRELHAAGAGVQVLPENLPESLMLLDLSNNSITNVSEQAVRGLFSAGRRVRLAGNPLPCACELLDTLLANSAQLEDLEHTYCEDGVSLQEARLRCGRGAALPAALAVLAVAVVAAAVGFFVSRPHTRLRIKALLARGAMTSRSHSPRPYDVFVAHAEGDARFVHQQLAPELRPRRLCTPQRDWPVGAWIPDQINASVNASSLTIVVISQAVLNPTEDDAESAQWTLAAARTAHAHTVRSGSPRLLLLLRGVRGSDLRPELAGLPRVQWGNLPKLMAALPPPRPVPPPVTPPAAA